MGRNQKSPRPARQITDDLEPYRQLIKIQKQLVKMARKHEKTRRECEVLREEMARELLELSAKESKSPTRLRARAMKFIQRLPRSVAADILRALNRKLLSSC